MPVVMCEQGSISAKQHAIVLLGGFRSAFRECGLGNTPAFCRIDDTLALLKTNASDDGEGSTSNEIEDAGEIIEDGSVDNEFNAFSFSGADF